MAVPTILVNSSTGSDSAASGAGPATAKTGSAGVSTGTTVVLDGSPDLSGVATDGSHVLFFNDTTSGNRNFAAITGKANSGTPTAQVTVALAFAVTTKAWAIGGKRASVYGSLRLVDNNGTDADAQAGWTVQMESGHTETFGGRLDVRVSGTTVGAFTLQGDPAASVTPVITTPNDIVPRQNFQAYKYFSIVGSGGPANGFIELAGYIRYESLTFSSFSGGISLDLSGGGNDQVINCTFTANAHAISVSQDTQIIGNYCVSQTGSAIKCNTQPLTGLLIYDNLITGAGAEGIQLDQSRSDLYAGVHIIANTIDSCTADGIKYVSTANGAGNSEGALCVINNILSNNGGYGLNVDSTLAAANSRGIVVRSNDTYNNSSGAYSPTGLGVGDPATNPAYVGSGNYTPTASALKGAAIPLSLNGATNYQWIGAIQALALILAILGVTIQEPVIGSNTF